MGSLCIGLETGENKISWQKGVPVRGQAGRSRGKWRLTDVAVLLSWSQSLPTTSQVQRKQMPHKEERVIYPTDLRGRAGIQETVFWRTEVKSTGCIITHLCVRWLCRLNGPDPAMSEQSQWEF